MSEKHCSRCGAVLPEVDEGLCPVCETPFGARTVAIEVTADDLAKLAAARDAGRKHALPGQSPAAPVPPVTMPVQTSGGAGGAPKGLIIGIALVVAALVAVLGLLLVSRGG